MSIFIVNSEHWVVSRHGQGKRIQFIFQAFSSKQPSSPETEVEVTTITSITSTILTYVEVGATTPIETSVPVQTVPQIGASFVKKPCLGGAIGALLLLLHSFNSSSNDNCLLCFLLDGGSI
jgi:hypothetical protein